jgi:predicted RNase H-like HicB family nuclease
LYENGFRQRNQDLRGIQVYDPPMTERATDTDRAVRTEARGGHWVAWIPDANGKPERSIVLVGETREEAEERARQWARLAAAR